MEPITSTIATIASSMLSRFFPNRDKAQDQAFELAMQEAVAKLELAKGNMATNTAEASNPNRTWITWRELIGYCCAFSVMWSYCLQPFITYFVVITTGSVPEIPELDMSQLMMLLFTMLGMGGYSTFEKIRGVKK